MLINQEYWGDNKDNFWWFNSWFYSFVLFWYKVLCHFGSYLTMQGSSLAKMNDKNHTLNQSLAILKFERSKKQQHLPLWNKEVLKRKRNINKMLLSLLLSIPKITWPNQNSNTFQHQNVEIIVFYIQHTEVGGQLFSSLLLFSLQFFGHKYITVCNNLFNVQEA